MEALDLGLEFGDLVVLARHGRICHLRTVKLERDGL